MGGKYSPHRDDKKTFIKFWSENTNGKDHLRDLEIGGRLILKRILKKKGGRVWPRFVWLNIESSYGLF